MRFIKLDFNIVIKQDFYKNEHKIIINKIYYYFGYSLLFLTYFYGNLVFSYINMYIN
jgi:hypothetical protein